MFRPWGWMFASVSAVGLLSGCTGSGGDYKTAQQIKQAKQAAGQHVHDEHHEHGAAGPHGGAIVELGDEEYHAEVVVDGKTHTLQVYLLGPDAKTSAAVGAQEAAVTTEDNQTLTLKAVPQAGDAKDKASKFELADEGAVDALLKAGFLHGSLQLEINGKPFRGDIDAHFDGSSHDVHAADKGDEKEMPPESSRESSTEDAPEKPETPESPEAAEKPAAPEAPATPEDK